METEEFLKHTRECLLSAPRELELWFSLCYIGLREDEAYLKAKTPPPCRVEGAREEGHEGQKGGS